MTSLGNRIVVLIDMDCFFCQVETKLQPEFAGKPLAVVQYNQWKSGGIIAVNYEARDFGVTRHMRGEEAKEKCPEIVLASVPCLRGKADTSRYRNAGREVIDVLRKNCNIVERASIDEAYLDITQIVDDKLAKGTIDFENILKQLETTFIVGHSECGINNEEQRSKGVKTWLSESDEDIQIQRLAIAAMYIENIRKEIFEITGFRCSAGISFNKILAKLACGLHKPNRQTILPASSVPELFGTLPVKKVRNLGGKLGDIIIDSLKCNVMGDLLPYSLQNLQNRFDEKTGLWLYNIARGIDNEPVTARLVSKSIGACKRFPGKQAIVDMEVLKHWLTDLSAEVCERLEQDLEENERRASLLTISFQYYQNKNSISQSKSCAITSYKPEKVAEQSFNIITKITQQLPISFLGISAGKFIKAKGSENFVNFFKSNATDKIIFTNNNQDKIIENSKINEKKTVENLKDNFAISKPNDESHLTPKNENLCDISPIRSNVNRRSSPCSSLQKSLKTDNFKQSFFMNILKEKQLKNKNSEASEKLDDNCKLHETFYSNDNNTSKLDKNDIKNDIATSSVNSNTQFDDSSCSNNSNEAAVRLQEIFPDLNDIDPNIVRLLPINLQEEAKKFLKVKETHQKMNDTNKVKSKELNKIQKGKLFNSKSSNKKSNIQNFFIKADTNGECNNNLKKCSQCDQLILINKFDEHNDYHVAQNLQKEMNQLLSNGESRKRKVIIDTSHEVKKCISDENKINLSNVKSSPTCLL